MPTTRLTTREAARLLGISAQSIRQWERLGHLAATKTASGIRLFARADIEKMRRAIEERRDAPRPSPRTPGRRRRRAEGSTMRP